MADPDLPIREVDLYRSLSLAPSTGIRRVFGYFASDDAEALYVEYYTREKKIPIIGMVTAMLAFPVYADFFEDFPGVRLYSYLIVVLSLALLLLFTLSWYVWYRRDNLKHSQLHYKIIAVFVTALCVTMWAMGKPKEIQCLIWGDRIIAEGKRVGNRGAEFCTDVMHSFVFLVLFCGLLWIRQRIPYVVLGVVCAFGSWHFSTIIWGPNTVMAEVLVSWFMVHCMVLIVIFSWRLEETSRHQFMMEARLKKHQFSLREQSDRMRKLLASILPDALIFRMMEVGSLAIADYADSATVTLSDIVGFTEWSAPRRSFEVAEMLTELYHRFDEHAIKHGVDKIKTIGDAYWTSCGIPGAPGCDHVMRSVKFGFAVLDEMVNISTYPPTESNWGELMVRVGVHTGHIVGGVVSATHVSYEVFGETNRIAKEVCQFAQPNTMMATNETVDAVDPRYYKFQLKPLPPSVAPTDGAITYEVHHVTRVYTSSESPSSGHATTSPRSNQPLPALASDTASDHSSAVRSEASSHATRDVSNVRIESRQSARSTKTVESQQPTQRLHRSSTLGGRSTLTNNTDATHASGVQEQNAASPVDAADTAAGGTANADEGEISWEKRAQIFSWMNSNADDNLFERRESAGSILSLSSAVVELPSLASPSLAPTEADQQTAVEMQSELGDDAEEAAANAVVLSYADEDIFDGSIFLRFPDAEKEEAYWAEMRIGDRNALDARVAAAATLLTILLIDAIQDAHFIEWSTAVMVTSVLVMLIAMAAFVRIGPGYPKWQLACDVTTCVAFAAFAIALGFKRYAMVGNDTFYLRVAFGSLMPFVAARYTWPAVLAMDLVFNVVPTANSWHVDFNTVYLPSHVGFYIVSCAFIWPSVYQLERHRRTQFHGAMREAEGEKRARKDRQQHFQMLKTTVPTFIINDLLDMYAGGLQSDEEISYEMEGVSVLFLELQLPELRNSLHTDSLVAVREHMKAVDELLEAHRNVLTKVKTVGDLYVIAGPLDDRIGDHETAKMEAHAAILSIAMKTKRLFPLSAGAIHNGRVQVAVIGREKVQLDVFGDTINTCARMLDAAKVVAATAAGSPTASTGTEDGVIFMSAEYWRSNPLITEAQMAVVKPRAGGPLGAADGQVVGTNGSGSDTNSTLSQGYNPLYAENRNVQIKRHEKQLNGIKIGAASLEHDFEVMDLVTVALRGKAAHKTLISVLPKTSLPRVPEAPRGGHTNGVAEADMAAMDV